MTAQFKEIIAKLKVIIERYRYELANQISVALSNLESVNITPNSKLFNLLLATWLAYFVFGDSNITLAHIAWAWWVLFYASGDNVLSFEEALLNNEIKQKIATRNGEIYNEVRYAYYNNRRRYKFVKELLIPIEDESGRQKKAYKINTQIMLSISKVIESFIQRYKKLYGDIVTVLNNTEHIDDNPSPKVEQKATTITERLFEKLAAYLIITPFEFEEFSINDASIILYLRNDAKIFERNPSQPPIDSIIISKFSQELFRNPLYTTIKLMQLAYSLAARYGFEALGTDDVNELLQNVASKPFFILTDEEYLRNFDPSKYYKLLGFYKSPAPGMIELVKDAIVINYEPVSFELFQAYICENGHITIDTLDSKTKVTICPICQRSIVGATKLSFSGVRAEIMSSIEGSVEHPKEYTVLIPIPMWDLLTMYNSYSLLLVKVRDVGKAKNPDKKPIYYPLIMFLPKYEHRLSSEERRIIEYFSRLPTWKILAYLRLAAYGSIRGMDHTILAVLLTAFSQGKQFIVIEKLREFSDSLKEVIVHVDKHTIAAPINTIVVGRSATAKTSIALKTLDIASPDVAKGLCYLTIPGSSRAGIFMGIDKQSKSRIKLGIEPINDGRIVVYDEVDKLAKMNNKEEIVSMFLHSIYHGKISLTQIKRSERPTRVARLFLMNSEMLQRDTFTDIIDLVDTLKTGVQSSKTTIKIFGEQSEQLLSRIDIIVYHPEYLGQYDYVQNVCAPSYMKYKDDFAEITYSIMNSIKTSDVKEQKIKIYSAIQKYFVYVRDGITRSTYFEVSDAIVKYLKNEIDGLKNYIISKYGSIDAVPALKYILYFDSDRRLESIIRIARAIAHMHLRDSIRPEDIKEAIAFHIYIHSFPFIIYYDETRKKATLDVLSLYKEQLGVFYDLIQNLAKLYKVNVLQTGEIKEEVVQPSDKIEIRNKNELLNYLIKLVDILKSEGLGTPYGLPITEIAKKLYEDIINNRIIVTCTAKECKELKKFVDLCKQLTFSDVRNTLIEYLLEVYYQLYNIGRCLINNVNGVTYIDILL